MKTMHCCIKRDPGNLRARTSLPLAPAGSYAACLAFLDEARAICRPSSPFKASRSPHAHRLYALNFCQIMARLVTIVNPPPYIVSLPSAAQNFGLNEHVSPHPVQQEPLGINT